MLAHEVKNYALLAYDGRLIVRGAAFRSSRTEPFGERFLTAALRALLADDVEGVRAAYLEAVDALRNKRLEPADVATNARLGKSAAEYARSRPRAREAVYEASAGGGTIDVACRRARALLSRGRRYSDMASRYTGKRHAPRGRGGRSRSTGRGTARLRHRALSQRAARLLCLAPAQSIYAGDFDQIFRSTSQTGLFDRPLDRDPAPLDRSTLTDLSCPRLLVRARAYTSSRMGMGASELSQESYVAERTLKSCQSQCNARSRASSRRRQCTVMERGGPVVDRATRERRAPRWAGETARRFEQRVDGDRLAWLQAGSGPPLLLLHGYAGDAQWWRRNLQALARTRTVYALDMPGFGASRLSGRYTFARSVDLLARWMDLHDLVPPDVAGHSMGGQLAVLLAARHPERIRRLVLLAPAGLPLETALPGIAVRALRSRLGADIRFTPIVLRGVLRAGPRVLWQALGQIRETDIRTELASVRVPTLIVWGKQDRLLLPDGAATIAATIAAARVRVIPGGHTLFFDRADFVNPLILSFLDRGSLEPAGGLT